MQMRKCMSCFTNQLTYKHDYEVLILGTGKKRSKGLQVLAQSLILAYNRVRHEILLDISSIVFVPGVAHACNFFSFLANLGETFVSSSLFFDTSSSFSSPPKTAKIVQHYILDTMNLFFPTQFER